MSMTPDSTSTHIVRPEDLARFTSRARQHDFLVTRSAPCTDWDDTQARTVPAYAVTVAYVPRPRHRS